MAITIEQLRAMNAQQLGALSPQQLEELSAQGLLTRYANDNDSTDQFGNPLGPTYNLKLGDGTNRAIRTGGEAGVSNAYKPTGDQNLALFAALAGGMGAYSAAGAAGNAVAPATQTAAPISQAAAPTLGAGATAADVAAIGGTVPAATTAAAPAATTASGGLMSGLASNPGAAMMGVGAVGQAVSGSKGTPAAPDFTSVANAESAAQQALNEQTLRANRYNENTPYGSREWTQDANGNWTSNTTLSPEQQALFDQENRLSQQYGDTAQSLLSNTQQQMSQPFQFSDTDRSRVEGAVYDSMASRLDPQFDRRETSLHTRLANQGLSPGSEAYTNAMQDYNFARNDAYDQANRAAVQLGVQETNNAFNRQAYEYNQPLNSLNALRSGSQATVPNFGAGAQQAQTQAPNLTNAAAQQYGAQTNAYNARQANQSNFWGGLMDLGSTMYRYR